MPQHPTHLLLGVSLLALAACSSTPPDTRIMVVPATGPHAAVAIPPQCPSWSERLDANSNQPHPSFGCATQHNLAQQIAEPADLLAGRDPGPDSAEKAAAAIKRYRVDQIYGLHDSDSPPFPIIPVAGPPPANNP